MRPDINFPESRRWRILGTEMYFFTTGSAEAIQELKYCLRNFLRGCRDSESKMLHTYALVEWSANDARLCCTYVLVETWVLFLWKRFREIWNIGDCLCIYRSFAAGLNILTWNTHIKPVSSRGFVIEWASDSWWYARTVINDTFICWKRFKPVRRKPLWQKKM